MRRRHPGGLAFARRRLDLFRLAFIKVDHRNSGIDVLCALVFCGSQRMIGRHRLVNDALKDEFEAGLHALSIKAKTPKEVEGQ